MTADEQNRAIAEVCGWRDFMFERHPRGAMGRNCGKLEVIPSYTSDLNAMHEAEKLLVHDQWCVYRTRLWKITNDARPAEYDVHATAAQRAEAFLKTLGLWKEEV